MLATPSRKRRFADDDDTVLTPKKVRTQPPRLLTPPPSTHKHTHAHALPSHLARLLELHKSIEQALSVALATSSSGFSPSPGADGTASGYIPNVVNHISLSGAGQARRCSIQDLSRLVWLWEWDGETLPTSSQALEAVNDDPFVEIAKDWMRGGMGIVLTQTMYSSRALAKRVAAYGIGIQVDKFSNHGAMAAIAQWTAGAVSRRAELSEKLESWVELHTKERVLHRQTSRASSPTPSAVPNLPFSALPRLPTSAPTAPGSSLARDLLDSASRKKVASPRVLFPSTPSSSSSSSRPSSPVKGAGLLSPAKISSSSLLDRPLTPETPHHLRAPAIPVTPSSSHSSEAGTPSARRTALADRIRLKSLSTPSKGSLTLTSSTPSSSSSGDSKPTATRTRVLDPEAVKRRLLLARLPPIAEALWMLFAAPAQSPSSNPTPPTRRRRAIPIAEVVDKVSKSRAVVSRTEVNDSLSLLQELCPGFLSVLVLGGEQWVAMGRESAPCPPSPGSRRETEAEVMGRLASVSPRSPSKASSSSLRQPPASPSKLAPPPSPNRTPTKSNPRLLVPPPSPGSPGTVRIRAGAVTLRDVKERIRRELEIYAV